MLMLRIMVFVDVTLYSGVSRSDVSKERHAFETSTSVTTITRRNIPEDLNHHEHGSFLRYADHSPPSCVEVKNAWRFTSTLVYVLFALHIQTHSNGVIVS
jgi:hypothetical protein